MLKMGFRGIASIKHIRGPVHCKRAQFQASAVGRTETNKSETTQIAIAPLNNMIPLCFSARDTVDTIWDRIIK